MKLIRFLLAFLLLPACWVVTQTVMTLLAELPQPEDAILSPSALTLVGGYLVWLFVFFTLPRPVRTYVFAHELTHALWGAVMGAEISRFKVSRDSGYVVLSKSNALIALAPYFFPLYTIIVAAIYGLLSLFWDLGAYQWAWLALVGFTWGFHFTFTIMTLLQHQTDVQEYGRLFSYALIYLFNVAGIVFWIVAVTPATLEGAVQAFGGHAVTTGAWCEAMWGRIRVLASRQMASG